MRNILGVVLLFAAACGGGGEDVPSCQQAFTHYYAAGCEYRDLNSGQPIPRDTMIANCLDAVSNAPNSCDGAVDDFLVCNGNVPSPSTTDAQCDCSQEFMAIAECD